MPTAENAQLEYEGGQTAVAMSQLTDAGDLQTFTSPATLWAGRSGFAPIIRPDGILTGGLVTVAISGSDDVIDVAALTCNLAGIVTSVSADADVSVTRPATDVAKVNSITINSSGAVAVVAGTDGATTAFSETRDAAGGPPLIPTTSIEIAQVRLTASTSAAVTESEVLQTIGLHRESAAYPQYEVDDADGSIMFLAALSAIHTGSVSKQVYASYATPIFAEVALADQFVPPETTHSVSSTQIYNTTLGSSSSTLNQGSFVAYLQDGVSDNLIQLKDENLWFRFHPNRYNTGHILCKGKLGVARVFPADDNMLANCTISAESAAIEEI